MENSTITNVTLQQWEMPFPFVVFTMVYFIANTIISLFINTLLIVIMNYSPSLRTPPNSHLMNICVNNILICVSMAFSIMCITFNSVDVGNERSEILSGVQLFLIVNSLLQYWGTFASIGYYRHKTIKKPTLSHRKRRQVVSRCITMNWVVSLILSMICSLSFAKNSPYSQDSMDPFRKNFYVGRLHDTTPEQMTILLILSTVFIIGFAIIVASYYSICKMLNITGRFTKNRVIPWQRALSLSSEVADLTLQSYASEDNNIGVYSISANIKCDNAIVHYQKCDNSLAFEDIIALENPMLAARIRQHYHQKRTLRETLSNGSTASTKSKYPEFSDISTRTDLERYQMIKNNSVLQKQRSRRDRISLGNATKNSLVMLTAYVVCSLPLIVCSTPGALYILDTKHRMVALLFCRLLFCINAPIYPIWYLVFSKRVRACLRPLIESLLIRLHVR